jgi:hypothetical protein
MRLLEFSRPTRMYFATVQYSTGSCGFELEQSSRIESSRVELSCLKLKGEKALEIDPQNRPLEKGKEKKKVTFI